ncbi:MAG: Gfo/Idh/MocA family oxidoreductase [Candidatus Tectomicrobia bacterium]|uniref:Gfo/Idh/MocA family oxidoreductase n=1 Tax=Tectimicrobiota bacterium TaxID=2528274 RepID=A0A937VZB6_UNCTE|nr:Gfo/Idh/MocA family oxidoreductase [Candidatus Tectomicrobia bacterium]
MTLGIALLGTGSIAARAFVPAVQAVDGACLVAVLSRDQARGAAFAQQHAIPTAYDRLEDLLGDPAVEAVIVATPDALHEAQVIAAARAGKHVLCEKPMTTTYAGCQRMAAAIQASGITFAMGYNNRYNKSIQCIKALLEAGEIGPVRYARAFLTSQEQDPRGWRAHREQSHYWALSAVGTHAIDIWRWFFGEPTSVGGGLASPVYRSVNDEITTLVLDYPGRLLAELAVAAVFRGRNRLELHGDEGAIIGEEVFGSRAGGPITCKGQVIAYEPNNSFVGEVADFVQAVQHQRPPGATLEDGLRNVAIMETARDNPLQVLLPQG